MALFVKICGIRKWEDAETAIAGGAGAIGFVFWPRSPRALLPAQAEAIISRIPAGVRRVGVFVDPTLVEVEAAIAAGVDVAQLHGKESAKFATSLAGRVEVWKGLPLRQAADVEAFRAYPATRFVVDAVDGPMPGGTGREADWTLAREAVASLPAPVLLAGGLTIANLAAAVAAVRPWGVDVSTGVEDAPGVKSPDKISAFLTMAASLDKTLGKEV